MYRQVVRGKCMVVAMHMRKKKHNDNHARGIELREERIDRRTEEAGKWITNTHRIRLICTL